MISKTKSGTINRTVTIDYGSATLQFKIPLFKDEDGAVSNIEDYLKIDIDNIIGELISFPIIMNRFGIILADAEDMVNRTKLDYEIWVSKTEKSFKKKKSDDGEKPPTVKDLETYIMNHPDRSGKIEPFYESQKNRDYIKSVYWAMKEKQENLKKISLTLQQGSLDDEDAISNAIQKLKTVTLTKVQKSQ